MVKSLLIVSLFESVLIKLLQLLMVVLSTIRRWRVQMLTDKQIEQAKKTTRYSSRNDILHEHNDCIRIAYEWLDAQKKLKAPTTKTYALKHLIENWCGRYISKTDVEVAAHIHPEIHGQYPHFNISARLTRPSTDRLKGISEAFTQKSYLKNSDRDDYTKTE